MIMHEEEMMKREERLTKEELFKNYEEAQKDGIDAVVLFIQMPTGEVEAITNPNVEAKMQYIDKSYDENLVHKNCKDIFILDCVFCDNSDTFDFGYALEIIKEGGKAARKGWNGKNQHIEMASNISYVGPNGTIVNPDHEAIGNKAIAFVGTSGVQLGWLASQADMLAEDWYEVGSEE